jgi:hypothetical protein
LRGLSSGVSGFNRWSFTNRGDLDGQWQLIRTWDSDNRKYYDNIEPEPAAFYGYGIITRFMAKHSSVVYTDTISRPDILSHTLKSEDGIITTYILNKSDSAQIVTIKMTGAGDQRLYLYRVSENEISSPDFKMNPLKEIDMRDGKIIEIELPAKSINTLSGFRSMHEDPARK